MVMMMVLGCVMSVMGQWTGEMPKKEFKRYVDSVATAGATTNIEQASEKFKRWLNAAENGEAWAQYNVGWCYYYGREGVSKNYSKAFIWFEKSANQGYAEAQYELGKRYECGCGGVTKNISTAIEWYQKAAAQGNEDAEKKLEELYGTPANNYAVINFQSSTTSSSTSYNLRAGVKSDSKITNVSVVVNNGRGIAPVTNNGYDFEINQNVSLNYGNNTITVSVTNVGGTTSKSLSVYVSGGNSNNNYQTTEKRVALVIGNAKYDKAPLKNPVNDATDLAEKLKSLGFNVTLKTDLTHYGFDNALKTFQSQANGCDVALIYYAGHGMEDEGITYLIPTDAPIYDEDKIKYESVDANYMLKMVSGAKNKIIILDACRNRPGRGVLHGGIGVLSATNAFFAYSTSSGKTAPDGVGRNSPYTAALLSALDVKNLTLPQLFQKVSQSVTAKNKNQIPWTSSSLIDDIILNK